MDLRATQYLPEVIHLQRCLYDKFNRQIDRKDSKKQTIAVFVQSLPNGTVIIAKIKHAFAQLVMCS